MVFEDLNWVRLGEAREWRADIDADSYIMWNVGDSGYKISGFYQERLVAEQFGTLSEQEIATVSFVIEIIENNRKRS